MNKNDGSPSKIDTVSQPGSSLHLQQVIVKSKCPAELIFYQTGLPPARPYLAASISPYGSCERLSVHLSSEDNWFRIQTCLSKLSDSNQCLSLDLLGIVGHVNHDYPTKRVS